LSNSRKQEIGCILAELARSITEVIPQSTASPGLSFVPKKRKGFGFTIWMAVHFRISPRALPFVPPGNDHPRNMSNRKRDEGSEINTYFLRMSFLANVPIIGGQRDRFLTTITITPRLYGE
jgi:hypothetical protein